MDTEPILLRQNSDGTISNDLAEENAKAASKITVNNGNGKTATKKFGSVEDLQQSVALIAEYGNGSARLITLSELIQRGMITEQHARDITKQLSMTEIEINGRTVYVPSYQANGLMGAFTDGGGGGIIKTGINGKESIQDEKNYGIDEKLGSTRTKTDIVLKNREQGRAFEEQSIKELTKGTYIDVEAQISIRTNENTRIRADALAVNGLTGELEIFEFKSSETAPLTKNQSKGFPELYQGGGIVIGKGKGIFTRGYYIPKGTVVKIRRPTKK